MIPFCTHDRERSCQCLESLNRKWSPPSILDLYQNPLLLYLSFDITRNVSFSLFQFICCSELSTNRIFGMGFSSAIEKAKSTYVYSETKLAVNQIKKWQGDRRKSATSDRVIPCSWADIPTRARAYWNAKSLKPFVNYMSILRKDYEKRTDITYLRRAIHCTTCLNICHLVPSSSQ